LIPPSLSDEDMAAELAALAQTGRRRRVATWYGKHGRPVETEGVIVTLRSQRGEITGYVCIMRDLTEWPRAQRMLEMRARQQALVAELTLRNVVAGDLQALLDDATALVGQTLDLELAAVGEKLPGDDGIGWRATYGWSGEAIARAPAADARSLVDYTLLAREPVISENAQADERFQISELFAERHPVGAVAVVIPGEKQPFGVLVAASQRRRTFSSEDVDFTTAVANVIGVAVERARIVERMEEVREGVRVRIARDLHDDALRELTDALALAAIARSASGTGEEAARWDELAAALQRVGQHLRGAVYDLRLTADRNRNFPDLLSDLVEIQAGKAVSCRVELTGREAIPPGSLGDRAAEVVRIVREAITNARLHSGAATITVDAGRSSRACLRIDVIDDGHWPDREVRTSSRPGTGIMGMFERADQLGAGLRIEGRPTGGTRVSLELALGED
jgi:signal transduction histidine kinase